MHSWCETRAPEKCARCRRNTTPPPAPQKWVLSAGCRFGTLRCLCCVISVQNQHIFLMCLNSLNSVFPHWVLCSITYEFLVSYHNIISDFSEFSWIRVCLFFFMNKCPLHFLIFHFSLFWWNSRVHIIQVNLGWEHIFAWIGFGWQSADRQKEAAEEGEWKTALNKYVGLSGYVLKW